jgi:hypothetical protein
MRNPSGETHKPRAVAPATFRDQATGIGQTLQGSRTTGAARKERVKASAPAGCIAVAPKSEGWAG